MEKKVKIVFRSTSRLLKLVVTVLIVFSVAALLALAWVRGGIAGQIQKLREEAAAMEQENQELQDKIDSMDTVDGVMDIAQEELGLVDPDTIIIKPE